MAVFVPPPVTRKADHTTGTWPVGTLIYDTTAHTLWAGDGSTSGGQVVTVAAADLPAFTNTTPGAVPSPAGAGNTYFLRADATWQVPAYPPAFSNTVSGLVPVPSPAAGSTKFLREDATWVVPSTGSGNMAIGNAVGSGTANRVLFEDGSVNLADSANLTYSSGTLTVASGNISCPGASTDGECFGANASTATNSVAIGKSATARGTNDVCIGKSAQTSSAGNSVSIGYSTNVTGDNGVAVGSALTVGSFCVAVGAFAAATGAASVAIGTSSSSVGGNGVSIGNAASAGGTESIGVGPVAGAVGFGGISIGSYSNTGSSPISPNPPYDFSIALGFHAICTAGHQMMIGSTAVHGWGINEIVFGDSSAKINMHSCDGAGTILPSGYVKADFSDTTPGATHGRIVLSAVDYAGDREGFRVDSDGSKALVSAFGATPTAQKTYGAATATGTYGSTEQDMLQKLWNMMRDLGFNT